MKHIATAALLALCLVTTYAAAAKTAADELTAKLVLAATHNRLDEARQLIERGADVNGAGSTAPIEAAARENHLDMIRLLVSKGAKVDGPDSDLLPTAIQIFKPETALLLIELGANVSSRSRGEAALIVAASGGKPELVKALLEKKANPKPYIFDPNALLMAAVASGDGATFDLVKPLFPELRVVDRYGNNALHAAALAGYYSARSDPNIVRTLLRAGVDPHAVSPDRRQEKDIRTPLRLAAVAGTTAMVEVLIEEVKYDPAELNVALFPTSRYCGPSAVEKLLKAGASPVVNGTVWQTPLHNAVWHRNPAKVKLLLDYKAPIDYRTEPLDRTPLLDAVAFSTPEIVAELLKRGADPKLKDKDGNDAPALARIRLSRGREAGVGRTGKSYYPEFPKFPNHGKDIAKLLAVPIPPPPPAQSDPAAPDPDLPAALRNL